MLMVSSLHVGTSLSIAMGDLIEIISLIYFFNIRAFVDCDWEVSLYGEIYGQDFLQLVKKYSRIVVLAAIKISNKTKVCSIF